MLSFDLSMSLKNSYDVFKINYLIAQYIDTKAAE